MKKRIRLALLILTLILSFATAAALGITVSASDGDGANDSEEETHVWKATYAGGVTEYFDTFIAPFVQKITREGTVLTLIPDSINVYMEDYVNVIASTDVTIDLRGKKLVCPETKEQQNDINKHIFSCSSSNGSVITFLMEDAELYAAHQGRTAIQMAGNGRLVVDGGERMGKLFAPGGIHVYTDNSSDTEPSVVRNMYVYKASGNMTGLISARKNGVIKVENSVVISPFSGSCTFYLLNNGMVILENTFAANLENGQLIGIGKDGVSTSFQVNDGSYLYGTVNDASTNGFEMTFNPTSYYSENLSKYAADETDMNAKGISNSVTVYSSTKVGSFTQESKKFKFNYRVSEEMKTTKTQNASSVWKMEYADGTVEYTDKFYAAFKYAADYKRFTLLKTVKVERRATAIVDGDFILDLDGHNLILSETYVSDYPSFISLSGAGSFTVLMVDSIVSLPKMAFITSSGVAGILIEGNGGFISAKCAVEAKDADVEVKGIYIDSTLGNAVSTDKNVILDGVTAVGNGVGQLVLAGANAALFNKTNLFATTGSCAVSTNGKLTVGDGSYVSGTVSASELYLEGYASFSHKPKANTVNKIILKENTKVSFTLMSYNGEKITKSKRTFTFGYIAAELDSDLSASFTMSESVAFNLYVPASVVEHGDFTVRISVDGLLMEKHGADAVKTVVVNREFCKFTYPYIYPSQYASEVKITLVSGSFSVSRAVALSSIFESSFAAAEDERVRSVMANYAAYASFSSGVKLENEEMNALLLGYSPVGGKLNVPLGGISFDVAEQRLVLTLVHGFGGSASAQIIWGGEAYTVSTEVGERDISIPVYRLDPSSPIILTLAENGTETVYSFGILNVVDTARELATGEYLCLYGAYLQSLAK